MGVIPLVGHVIKGYATLAWNPLFYLSVILVFVFYRRLNGLERDSFGFRATRPTQNAVRSLVAGILAGVAATVILCALGIVVAPWALTLSWVISFVLMWVRLRFSGIAYGAGIYSLIALIAARLPNVSAHWFQVAEQVARASEIAQLLALVGVLHLVESLLMLSEARADSSPLIVPGWRGKPVGAFLTARLWMIPLAVVVAAGDSIHAVPQLSWWPLLSLGGIAAGTSVAAVPVFLTFTGLTASGAPAQRVNRLAGWTGLYGLVLLVLAVFGTRVTPLLFVAALFAVVGYEAILTGEDLRDRSRRPIYVPETTGGVRVLSTLPDSAARHIGVLPGETILRVNTRSVSSAYDIHFAIHTNPAYVRLDVVDKRGELRVIGTGLYEGMHHLLGLLLAPEGTARARLGGPLALWSRRKAQSLPGSGKSDRSPLG